MGADPRLRLTGRRHHLPDAQLPVLEQLEDLKPGRVAKDPKEPRRRTPVGRR